MKTRDRRCKVCHEGYYRRDYVEYWEGKVKYKLRGHPECMRLMTRIARYFQLKLVKGANSAGRDFKHARAN